MHPSWQDRQGRTRSNFSARTLLGNWGSASSGRARPMKSVWPEVIASAAMSGLSMRPAVITGTVRISFRILL